MRKEAMYYTKNENGEVSCGLCPHCCIIKEGRRGICGVREHQKGVLDCVNYGEVSSFGLDPIEKKPLFHYKPGSYIASVGSFGCNFNCGFCQNASIAKNMPKTKILLPEELIKMAQEMKVDGNIGIAFTYNEPSIWYEYVLESAQRCQNSNMDVILVSNGYISREPLKELIPFVNAMNIDLKAFNKEFYTSVCKGDLKSVLATIEYTNDYCHVEITTLLIGGYNDKASEIRELAKWVASINPDLPLHLSRYHPAYKFTDPPTSIESIQAAYSIAKEYLKYVYIGNVRGVLNNTNCYECGEKLVERNDFETKIFVNSNKCPHCGAKINIVL